MGEGNIIACAEYWVAQLVPLWIGLVIWQVSVFIVSAFCKILGIDERGLIPKLTPALIGVLGACLVLALAAAASVPLAQAQDVAQIDIRAE